MPLFALKYQDFIGRALPDEQVIESSIFETNEAFLVQPGNRDNYLVIVQCRRCPDPLPAAYGQVPWRQISP